MENEKRMNQIILLVLSLYVPRNPYNAKAVLIDLKEMSLTVTHNRVSSLLLM